MQEEMLKFKNEYVEKLRGMGTGSGNGIEYVPIENADKVITEIILKMDKMVSGLVQEYEEKLQGGLFISKEKMLKGARQTKLSDAQIMEIAQRHSSGESVSRIAREYGISRGTVLNYVERSRLTPQEAERAVSMYYEGKSVSVIAEQLKKDHRPVRTFIADRFGKETFCVECGDTSRFYQRQAGSNYACVKCGKFEIVAPTKPQEAVQEPEFNLENLEQWEEPETIIGDSEGSQSKGKYVSDLRARRAEQAAASTRISRDFRAED